ncbi:MAG: hypothetical protein BJ554DRAFT_222 [Olpidium bornovanus]|uniref:Uncharacterized protein n=1 Tax=Olpidium bornovanus TaxID=278681 RepID=A0A8H8A254_9FUNG|nr:MAG: hypothetical protein BJ554DRAFT_222 [Olpidium bornovanus]
MPDLTDLFRHSVEKRETAGGAARSSAPRPGVRRRGGGETKPRTASQKRTRLVTPLELSDVFLREAAYLGTARAAGPFASSGSKLDAAGIALSPLDAVSTVVSSSPAAMLESQKEERDRQARLDMNSCMEKIAGLEEVSKGVLFVCLRDERGVGERGGKWEGWGLERLPEKGGLSLRHFPFAAFLPGAISVAVKGNFKA